ncbi:MAG: lytic transglycosylase domain-containing protein [Treponema sp.]|nr:lytic transglycosylase domain-containing protein [Treponema sp.]
MRLKSLTRIHPEAPFYAGLILKGPEQENPEPRAVPRAGLLFILALESPSSVIRGKAALELILPVLEAGETALAREALSRLGNRSKGQEAPLITLRAACLYRLGRFADVPKLYGSPGTPAGQGGDPVPALWDRILPFLAERKARKAPDETAWVSIKNFFFSLPVTEERRWIFAELERLDPGLFSESETAALFGRAATARSAFGQGLSFFRQVLETEKELFFRYPELITDLGRCFQFTPEARKEGLAFFSECAALFENPGKAEAGKEDPGETRLLKYRFLYFAGRIARQDEQYLKSSEFFERALDAAPDSLQADACIWYILMNVLAELPEPSAGNGVSALEAAADLVKSWLPRMSQASYFDDVMDRLSRRLVSARQWKTMLGVFDAMDLSRTGAAAQYAWILGRAVQEGFLETRRTAEDFFKTAFEAGNASMYYRVMSASKLGISLVPAGESPAGENSGGPDADTSGSPATQGLMDFLLGFFEFNAPALAAPYIREQEQNLSISDLRVLAKNLGGQGSRDESINLAARYMAREDYTVTRDDLLLFYPRHFQELIEKNARDAGISAGLLFGLVRTESSFMPDAVSRSGAVGLTQLMAPTALDMAGRIARQGGPDYRSEDGIDLKNPEVNARIGAYYLRYLTDQLESPMLALIAYNGGLGRIRRWLAADNNTGGLAEDLFLETIEFDETRDYGRRVLAAAAVYGYLYYGMSMEAVVRGIYRTVL